MGSKLYGTCPICGKKLCRAKSGSEVDVYCPTCRKNITIEIKADGKVISTVGAEQPEQIAQ